MIRGFIASLLFCAGGAQAAILADPGFGSAGSAAVSTPPVFFYGPPRLGVLPDGRILVSNVGDVTGGVGLPLLHTARLSPDGVVDVGFGSAGVSTVTLSNLHWEYPELQQMQTQPDGGALLLVRLMRSVTPEQMESTNLLVRLGADGNLAPGFNGGAVLPLDNLQGYASKLVSQGNTTLVFASGGIEPAGSRMQIMRIRADGIPDPGFGAGGTLSMDNAAALASDLMILPDGGFQVLHTMPRQGAQREYNFWRRFRADGSLDTAYGSGGDLVIPRDPLRSIDRLFALPGGRQLGASGSVALVLLDSQGRALNEFLYYAAGTRFNAQPLGAQILLSVEQRFGGVPPPSDGTYLHLIDTAGNVDTGFGDPPNYSWRPNDRPNDSFAAAADAQGRILLARRDHQAGMRVFRYNIVRGGNPTGMPVPVLSPAGLALAALGLLWLARRRLLPG